MQESKQSLKSKVKEKIASIGWYLFLWGNNFTQEQYWEEIYQQEKMFKENQTVGTGVITLSIMSEEIKKGESFRKGYMQGIKEKEQEIIVLRSDIQRAIGYIQGLGHHDKYLEEKYMVEEPTEQTLKDLKESEESGTAFSGTGKEALEWLDKIIKENKRKNHG